MTKILVFLLFLLPATFGFSPAQRPAGCDCQEITNLQKTGQTSSSVSWSWSGQLSTGFRAWYTREEDHYTSSNFYPTGASYTFSNLTSGTYRFYFVNICGEEESGLIGSNDVIFN